MSEARGLAVEGPMREAGLEPVINFLEEKDVQSKYIPALRLGCRRSESLIRVM
jgi:hypothetical protein